MLPLGAHPLETSPPAAARDLESGRLAERVAADADSGCRSRFRLYKGPGDLVWLLICSVCGESKCQLLLAPDRLITNPSLAVSEIMRFPCVLITWKLLPKSSTEGQVGTTALSRGAPAIGQERTQPGKAQLRSRWTSLGGKA